MGLFIGQNEKRSELQSKIIADLQEKVRSTSVLEGEPEPVESTLLENQHETRSAGVVIAVLVTILVAVIVFMVARS